jgi:ribosomal protein S18 acetylase RimI-like enzyme
MLVGAAALRWPATLEAPAWLWGPMVHPSVQGTGIGSRLLGALQEVIAARPGIRVVTTEIPESRAAGWSLYERAGWRRTGSASLLTRTLPSDTASDAESAAQATVDVRTMRPGDYLDPELAELYAGARPDLGHATARDTYTRWTVDERYDPEGLLLAETRDGLVGAALVYPVTHNRHGEPYEALLADVITCTRLDPPTGAAVRTALVGAALRAGTALGAALARAVVADAELTATLLAAGFQVVDGVRYYGLNAVSRLASPA